MTHVDSLIHAGHLIPMDHPERCLNEHSIAVQDGVIVDILATEQARTRYQAKQEHNLANHAVIPGLINAHTHVPMNLFRGLADDLQLFDWLQNHMWKAEADVMCDESAYIGTQLAIAEMLLSGTTCYYDMFFFCESIIDATVAAGMRATIGVNVMDVPNKWANNAKECLDKAVQLMDKPQHPLITLALAAQGPYTNSDESLIRIRELANERNSRIIMHLHETKGEIADSIKQYQKRPLKRLHDIGFLGPDVLAIHMVHLNDEDLALCREHQLNIAHCPESNLKLASGFANMLPLQQAGLNVSIGTDSVASNNDLDMIAEMRQTAFIAKALNEDSTIFSAPEVLHMATMGAAKAMGMEQQIGSLEIGKRADITAIDLSDPQTQPLYNPIAQIVYAANRKQVSHVWVDGQLKVDNHQLTELNQDVLLQQAQQYINMASAYQYPAKAKKDNGVKVEGV